MKAGCARRCWKPLPIREIVFQSTEITASKIAEGLVPARESRESFRLHGVTNPQRVDAQLRVMEDEIRLSGDCGLLQPAYRIKRVSALAGMITLKDELKIDFRSRGPQAGRMTSRDHDPARHGYRHAS